MRVLLAYVASNKSIIIKMVWLKLTQARVISKKRLWRKVDVISDDEFYEIKKNLKILSSRNPARCGVSRRPKP
jgi:hypothetical protein